MNVYNLTEPWEVVTVSRGIHEYNISTKYRQIMMLIVYSGGGGGGGASGTAGANGGGGSGGLPGSWYTVYAPTVVLPKNLSITVPAGGAGGTPGGNGISGDMTFVTSKNGTVNSWLTAYITGFNYSSAGLAGTSTNGGGQPSTAGTGNNTRSLFNYGYGSNITSGAYVAGIGPNNTNIGNLAIGSMYRPNGPGTGGGGISAGVAYSGNGIQFASDTKYFPGVLVPGGANTGGVGTDGIQTTGNTFPFTTGGTGGGANLSGPGGKGGDGAIGSGGGGGGAGTTGGAGGRGGDGLVVFILW